MLLNPDVLLFLCAMNTNLSAKTTTNTLMSHSVALGDMFFHYCEPHMHHSAARTDCDE